jgi:hypothetical protein
MHCLVTKIEARDPGLSGRGASEQLVATYCPDRRCIREAAEEHNDSTLYIRRRQQEAGQVQGQRSIARTRQAY